MRYAYFSFCCILYIIFYYYNIIDDIPTDKNTINFKLVRTIFEVIIFTIYSYDNFVSWVHFYFLNKQN